MNNHKEKHMEQYRQGDVLIERIGRVSGEALKDEAGRVILAHGEATGHAHAISAKDAQMFVAGVLRKVKTTRPTRVLHEEHAPIPLDKGAFEIIRQREYHPEEIRNVAD